MNPRFSVTDYPTLHTLVKDPHNHSPHEVRHLLLHSVEGASDKVLTKLISGVHSEIATGKHYEMEKKVDAVMQEWGEEGFRYRREREPAYEDLKSTVTLAMLMGFKVVYDPLLADVRRMNLTGAVPLAQWQGRAGKNGGGYQYAFTGMTILASPTPPPGHGINMSPSTKESFQTIRQAIELQKTVGALVELVLG
jgi:hypothetical protein